MVSVIERQVVDKTGELKTHPTCPIPLYAVAYSEMSQVVFVFSSPVLSTIPFSLNVCIIYKQISEIDPKIMKIT